MFEGIMSFREKLSTGQSCLGTLVTLCDPTVTEALCGSVDFLWVDLEHTAIGMESLLGHLMAAQSSRAAALVRVPSSEPAYIKRVLDIGVEGVIVPQIRSASEVRTTVAACRYTPFGTRGWGPRRAMRYGRQRADDYVVAANENLFVSVQIEHADALAHLDEIVGIEGLDSVVIGPYDLSASLGLLGQLYHPQLMSAYQAIIGSAHAAGKTVGVGTGGDVDFAARAVKLGIDWIQIGIDYTCMIQRVEELHNTVRETAKG